MRVASVVDAEDRDVIDLLQIVQRPVRASSEAAVAARVPDP
jgi:hypothetical protein